MNTTVRAVRILDPSYVDLRESDFKPYGENGLSINAIWGRYAREYWN